MAYQLLPDGAVVADTLDEFLAYQAATTSKPRPRSQSPKPDRKAHRTWTQAALRDLLEDLRPRTRELLIAALRAGHGCSTATLAEQLGWARTGLGNRFAKLSRDVRAFSPALALPIRLVGEPGAKVLEFDPEFAEAAKEAAALL